MIGQEIRRARKAIGLKQVELARKTNLKPSTICDFEAGRSKPSADSLKKIAEALGVSVDSLLMSSCSVNNVKTKSQAS